MIGLLSYRMRDTKGDSDKFGNCEVCGMPVTKVYILNTYETYKKHDGTISRASTPDGCWFGHSWCLSNKTRKMKK